MKVHDWLEIDFRSDGGYRITVWDGPKSKSLSVVVNQAEDVERFRQAVGKQMAREVAP